MWPLWLESFINPFGTLQPELAYIFVFVDFVPEDDCIPGLGFLQLYGHGLLEYSKIFGELFQVILKIFCLHKWHIIHIVAQTSSLIIF